MSKNLPKWFIQRKDGSLYGYFSLDILLIDLSINRAEKVTILERRMGLSVQYVPMAEQKLRERQQRNREVESEVAS